MIRMSQDFERAEFTFNESWLMNFFGHAPKEKGVYNHFVLAQVLVSLGTFVLICAVRITFSTL